MPIEIKTAEDTKKAIVEMHTMLTEILDHLTGGKSMSEAPAKRGQRKLWKEIGELLSNGEEYHAHEVFKRLREKEEGLNMQMVYSRLDSMTKAGVLERVRKACYRLAEKEAAA